MFEFLFNKLAGLKYTPTQVLSREYCELFKSNSFEKHLRATASVRTILSETIILNESKLKAGLLAN